MGLCFAFEGRTDRQTLCVPGGVRVMSFPGSENEHYLLLKVGHGGILEARYDSRPFPLSFSFFEELWDKRRRLLFLSF